MPQSKKVARPALPKAKAVTPPRTEVSDDDTRAVRGALNAVDRGDESTSPQAGKATRRRVDKPEKATYYIPEDVAEEIAIIAIRRKTSASAIATEALEAYIAAQKKRAS